MTENIIPDWAVPGAEVVVITAWSSVYSEQARVDGVTPLIKGDHHVIRAIINTKVGLGIALVGIHNAAGTIDGIEHAYHAANFRPVKKLEEDVALFESLLQPSDERLGVLLDDLNTAWLEAEQTSFAFDDWREKFRS